MNKRWSGLKVRSVEETRQLIQSRTGKSVYRSLTKLFLLRGLEKKQAQTNAFKQLRGMTIRENTSAKLMLTVLELERRLKGSLPGRKKRLLHAIQEKFRESKWKRE